MKQILVSHGSRKSVSPLKRAALSLMLAMMVCLGSAPYVLGQSVTATLDTTAFAVTPSFTNLYPLVSPVPFSQISSMYSVTITFTNPPPGPGGGQILINSETFSLTPFLSISSGQTSQTLYNAPPDTSWFGTGLTGTEFAFVQIANSALNAATWDPGIVTITWARPAASAVPTMNEWGMIILTALLGVVAVYYLRRRRLVI